MQVAGIAAGKPYTEKDPFSGVAYEAKIAFFDIGLRKRAMDGTWYNRLTFPIANHHHQLYTHLGKAGR